MEDSDPQVVEFAAQTLGELGDEACTAALEERIQSDEMSTLPPALRRVLFSAYAQMRGTLAVPTLGRILKSSDEATQLAAIAALGIVRTPGAIAALRQTGFSFNKRIRNAVREALEPGSSEEEAP